MIRANDLRVGNWVNVDYTSGLKPRQIEAKVLNDKLYLGAIQPIPLTEEILLKCGFKKVNKIFYRKGALTIEIQSFGHFRISLDKKMLCNVKHLHQLQNLYFALTNEELKIEL